VFSPQKQMGRPRKRRREGEADEDVVQFTEINGNVNETSDLAALGNFGMVTPPQFQDTTYLADTVVIHNGTTSQLNSIDSHTLGVSPVSAME
jgi:hypothetical protein